MLKSVTTLASYAVADDLEGYVETVNTEKKNWYGFLDAYFDHKGKEVTFQSAWDDIDKIAVCVWGYKQEGYSKGGNLWYGIACVHDWLRVRKNIKIEREKRLRLLTGVKELSGHNFFLATEINLFITIL